MSEYDIGQLDAGTVLRIDAGIYQYFVTITPYRQVGHKTVSGATVVNTSNPQLLEFMSTNMQVPPSDWGISRMLKRDEGFTLYFADDAFPVAGPVSQVVRFTGGGEQQLI